jgi:hypothetical protein
MPDLVQTLRGNDLAFLRMVAGTWGIDLEEEDVSTGILELASALKNRQLAVEVVESLPSEARRALEMLAQNEGRMPWALFCRRFGEMRVMGPARRDRERPDLNPVSPAEVLWYRALIGKAFFNLPPEPQEFAYIPADLIDLLQLMADGEEQPIGQPSSPMESTHPIPATDGILDDACTLLAGLRCGRNDLEKLSWRVPLDILRALLQACGLVGTDNLPSITTGRAFLEAQRGEALAMLVRGWIDSNHFNELRLMPGLCFEGSWMNAPLATRQTLMGILSHLPQQTWWSLPAFIAGIKESQPDFQRSDGDYDSWFIYKSKDGTFLRGFSFWEDVDGSLIRFMITGPMHWLGLFDLASDEPGKAPTAFRPSAWAEALRHGKSPGGLGFENGILHAGMNGRLTLSTTVPRALRYQVARFCSWEGSTGKEYIYRPTPDSLERARKQGLLVKHLITLLRKNAGNQIPPILVQALENWERLGVQASLERVTLLKVVDREVLTALRKTRAKRFLGTQISDTVVVVSPGGDRIVRDALAECGYLPDSRVEEL